MSVKSWLMALVPALLMAAALVLIKEMPTHTTMLDSAISPDLPLGYDLEGWYGVRTQESAEERLKLAADTIFSKGVYVKRRDDPDAPRLPDVSVSIVYSGQDMNTSIHRPEVCLPAQGHVSLDGETDTIALSDGREIPVTRLASMLPDREDSRKYVHYIHYYVFVGHDCVKGSHLARTFTDIVDRALLGQVQRWAYFQVGSCWGGDSGVTEEQCDAMIRQLISELLPRLIDWKNIRL